MMKTMLKAGPLSALGSRSMIAAEESGDRFTMLEITLAPRELVAPLHRHSREDEYTFVLAGRIGAMLADRDQWHTFWNAGDEPARVLEIICPAGFERFFDEFAQSAEPPSPELSAATGARYGLAFGFESASGLMQEHGVTFIWDHQ